MRELIFVADQGRLQDAQEMRGGGRKGKFQAETTIEVILPRDGVARECNLTDVIFVGGARLSSFPN